MTTAEEEYRNWASLEQRAQETAWGYAQSSTEIEQGLVQVSTSRHGGLVMDFAHYMKLPDDLRSLVAPGGFAEEDCHMGIVLLLFGLATPHNDKHAIAKNVMISMNVIRDLATKYADGTMSRHWVEEYTEKYHIVRKHVSPVLGRYILDEYENQKWLAEWAGEENEDCTNDRMGCNGCHAEFHQSNWDLMCDCIQKATAQESNG